jgi:hypothetical protein
MIVNATQRTIQTIQRLLSIETSARRLDCTVSLKPSYYQRGSISRKKQKKKKKEFVMERSVLIAIGTSAMIKIERQRRN